MDEDRVRPWDWIDQVYLFRRGRTFARADQPEATSKRGTVHIQIEVVVAVRLIVEQRDAAQPATRDDERVAGDPLGRRRIQNVEMVVRIVDDVTNLRRGRDQPGDRREEWTAVPVFRLERDGPGRTGSGDLCRDGKNHRADGERAAHRMTRAVAPGQRSDLEPVGEGRERRARPGERDRVRRGLARRQCQRRRVDHDADPWRRGHSDRVRRPGTDVRDGAGHRLHAVQVADRDRRLVQVAGIDRAGAASELARAADEGHPIAESVVVDESRIHGRVGLDVARALAERARYAAKGTSRGRHQRGLDHHRRPVRMTLLQQGAQSCDVRGGHGSAAQKVEQAAAVADGRNPGEDVHRRGREVGLEDVTTRGPARARRRKGGEERSGNGSGDVAGQFRRRRAAARIDVRLDRRAVRFFHVHGGHMVDVGAHAEHEVDVSQDHARAARLLHREALVDGRVGAKGTIAQDDLAGRLRGIEVADEAERDTSGEGRSIRWSRIGRYDGPMGISAAPGTGLPAARPR